MGGWVDGWDQLHVDLPLVCLINMILLSTTRLGYRGKQLRGVFLIYEAHSLKRVRKESSELLRRPAQEKTFLLCCFWSPIISGERGLKAKILNSDLNQNRVGQQLNVAAAVMNQETSITP